jgi:hypothetical protein
VIVSSPIRTAEPPFGRPMPARQHPRGCMICRLVRAVSLALLTLITMQDQRSGAQTLERPYFMPPAERDRLHNLISKEAWAKADLARTAEYRHVKQRNEPPQSWHTQHYIAIGLKAG